MLSRHRVATAVCALAIGGTGVLAPSVLAKHDKTYAAAKTACSSLPTDKLALGLGLPANASMTQVANAYAKRQKGSAAKKRSARAGCLAGLRHHH